MRNRVFLFLIVLASALASGCAFKTTPYGVSVANVEAIKSAGIKPVAVEKFESFSPGLTTLMCRGTGPVTVEPSYEAYIEKALIDELKLAGVYDVGSKIRIKGRLDKVDFSSAIGGGKWFFSVTVSSESDEGYSTSSEFPFESSFVGDRACQEVAQAFVPAVQRLIKDVVSDARFKKLAQ
ncbi:hypothetical protein GCM10007935_24760 [Hydrogenophaga electricum]|uniref:Lipoprotein n=1 Tax=Hydrogenophaga electricum TaxID=1230953 RepID=A0ABQ6C3Z2_9BURK|nr:hypothetical protein GCM10007935_24760 [Hydrogenophaga electricum]